MSGQWDTDNPSAEWALVSDTIHRSRDCEGGDDCDCYAIGRSVLEAQAGKDRRGGQVAADADLLERLECLTSCGCDGRAWADECSGRANNEGACRRCRP